MPLSLKGVLEHPEHPPLDTPLLLVTLLNFSEDNVNSSLEDNDSDINKSESDVCTQYNLVFNMYIFACKYACVCVCMQGDVGEYTKLK